MFLKGLYSENRRILETPYISTTYKKTKDTGIFLVLVGKFIGWNSVCQGVGGYII